jgi:hypothetical protein
MPPSTSVDEIETTLKFEDGTSPCMDWLNQYKNAQYITYVLSLTISVIGLVQSQLFRILSSFERAHFISDQMVTNLYKMFIAQYINVGFSIILIYKKLPWFGMDIFGYTPLQGKYRIFDVEWYRFVGSTIIVSMLMNIIAPHIAYLIIPLFKSCFRCLDRGLSFSEQNSFHILQEDYE